MKLLTLLLFLLLIYSVNAINYEQEFQVINKETNVNILINFDNKQDFNFYLDLPRDVNNVKVFLDNKENNFEVIKSEFGNIVNINGDAKELKINYDSKSYIEQPNKNYFTAEITSLLDSELKIKVILPEGATLDKSFTQDFKETSIYPKPSKVETNGKNLIITWQYNTRKDENYPLFMIYNTKKFNYIYFIIIFIILSILILFKFRRKQVKIKKIVKQDITKYLKDEEKLIINILKQKNNECTQATLVTLTNMSKASLSRLLDELEQRNIIYKEKQGNKNLIILKKR